MQRIAEHASVHALPLATVVLHGGEPLLYGVERTRSLLESLRTVVEPRTRLDLRIHTNGVRLDREFLELFLEYGVKVGVSLDGDRPANDLHRLYANGRTSHPAVLRALALLREPRYRPLYAGILCTVDLRNDPIRVYEALAAEQPPRADLLLPHATWDHPPLRPESAAAEAVPAYAAWLGAVYDRWDADGRPFPVRTFDSIAATLQGFPSRTEALGLAPRDLIVVETDGSFEQADSLKTAYDGAPATGFDVFDHSLDEVAAHAGFTARQGGIESLCATCRACPVVEVCGGGLYAHRYRTGSGFDNPSAYCEDLKALIHHVRDRRPRAAAGAGDPVAHVLPLEDFDAFASGYGGADAVRRLGEPQMSICRALITEIGRQVESGSPFADAVAEIRRLDETNPAALAAVLADPYTRVWAVRLLTASAQGRLGRADFARLAEIAAGAALLAGAPVRLPLHVVGGVVHLPTIGALVLGGPDRTAMIETREGGVAIVAVDGRKYEGRARAADLGSAPNWSVRRRLDAGPLSVAIEDTDPYRDCHQWRAAQRLSPGDARVWRDRFDAAVAYLEDSLPGYLPGLSAGLSTLTPLTRPSGGGEVSGTARDAYGAVGLALPADGQTLALLMIHEFQHVKLGALLDMYDFYDPADTRLFYAPWRDDPRPLEGLYQGTYAHLAVTDYWRARRHDLAAASRESAEANFARWRTQTAKAVDVLLESGALTAHGERFARAMGETLAAWLEEPVGSAATRAARSAARDHHAAWEARRRA